MKDDKQIDDFILGLLSEHEEQSFRQDLKTNMELAAQVDLRREMINGIEAFGRKAFKEELIEIHKEVIDNRQEKGKRRSLFPYIAAAASVLILIVALFYLMDGNGAQSPNAIVDRFFEISDISIAQRDNGDEKLLTLEKLFNDKKYRDALPLFEEQLNINPTSNLLLGAGIAYLKLDQAQKALSYFEQITAKKDFNFENEVSWYSALAYLKLEDIVSAKKALQALVEDKQADHHEDATKLLEILD